MCDQSGIIRDLSARSDYGLVLKIMQTVEIHNRAEHVNPEPRSLRDTLLAVAALLHIEVIKKDHGNRLAAAGDREQLRETFAGAARCQLDAAAEAAGTVCRNQAAGYQ
jgi:hypothetical protein